MDRASGCCLLGIRGPTVLYRSLKSFHTKRDMAAGVATMPSVSELQRYAVDVKAAYDKLFTRRTTLGNVRVNAEILMLVTLALAYTRGDLFTSTPRLDDCIALATNTVHIAMKAQSGGMRSRRRTSNALHCARTRRRSLRPSTRHSWGHPVTSADKTTATTKTTTRAHLLLGNGLVVIKQLKHMLDHQTAI